MYGSMMIFNDRVESGKAIVNKNGFKAANEDVHSLIFEILNLFKQQKSRRIIFFMFCNCVVVYYLWDWSTTSNSLAFKAYVNTVAFNVFSLIVCFISVWVEQNTLRENHKLLYFHGLDRRCSTLTFASLTRCKSESKSQPQLYQAKAWYSSFLTTGNEDSFIAIKAFYYKYCDAATSISALGLEKYEILALFLFSGLSLIIGFVIAIEAMSKINQHIIVHEGRLAIGAALGLASHVATIIAYPDAGLNHMLCKALPCPTVKGVNPILSANLISFSILCGIHFIIHYWDMYNIDKAGAIAMVGLVVASMLPLVFFTAIIILKKLSYRMSEQLDQCLREALIIDGVLEFRNERFWIQSFGKLAGSLEVRVRKNVDENHVLCKVIKSLSKVVSTLNVQEFRETTNVPRRAITEFPLEYYVDELCRAASEKTVKKEEPQAGEDDNARKSVKIEQILNRCDSPPKYQAEQSGQMENAGYAISLCNHGNFSLSHKNYLFRQVPLSNTLLLGARGKLDEIQFPVKLYC